MTPVRVVVADDHPIVRAGICEILEEAPDLTVVGETGDGKDVIRLVEELVPDVLVLDMELPGMDGVQVAEQLQKHRASARILALSAYNDQRYIQGILDNGIDGYLIKDEASRVIVDAVRGISHGEKGWISRRITAQLSTLLERNPERKELTQRELAVMGELVSGKTNQEIAYTLGISEKTVEKHLNCIFGKLGVFSRVEAAVSVIRDGLI